MEYFMDYFFPAVVLFIAQATLCLWSRNKYIRLIPTVIALCITAYHIGVVLQELQIPHPWIALAWGYLALTVLPYLAAIGFGWMIYVVKLMIREAKDLQN